MFEIQVFDISALRIFIPHELDHLLCGRRELWKVNCEIFMLDRPTTKKLVLEFLCYFVVICLSKQ